MRSLQLTRWWVLFVGMMLAIGPAAAGTITVQWDPVTDSDLAGYRLYWGPTAGSHANQLDAGKTTSATIGNAPDCSITYSAVRAYDTGGLESTADSNSVKGFPRPIVSSISPNTVKQGQTINVTVSGTNFDAGIAGDASRPSARLRTSNSGLTITNTKVTACGTITATITASSSAALGYATLYVENPDLSYSNPSAYPWVYGQLANAINVTSGSTDSTPPTVSSTNPGSGATNVAVTVKPTITFSEAMLASSINATTVKLLDSAGVAVAQASGSPALSSDGKTATITPAANLKSSAQYKIQAVGGSSGVKDAAGNAMASTWTQGTAWTTASSDTTAPTVSTTYPAANATNVAVNVKPAVTFSEPMMASTITSTNVKLIDPAGVAVAQASGSPSLSADGKQATITPAANLKNSTQYRIQVLGGSTGVKDTAGNAMASTYTMSPGFVTAASSDTTAPTVSSTNPANTATGIAVSVKPTVTFSEAMMASTVTATNVKLLDSAGVAVTQAAGSPSLSSDGRTATISPAASLKTSSTYRIQVLGGSTGVKDTAGNALATTYTQSPGFTTSSSASAPTKVVSTAPAAGAQNVAVSTRTFRITYNNDISALWSSLSRTELQKAFRVSRFGRALTHTSTSPAIENGGKTVAITITSSLLSGATYRTEAGPVPSHGLTALRNKGIDPGVLTYFWYTNPGWTTASSLTSAASRDTAQSTATATALTIPENPGTLPQENTNQPVTSEFLVEFDKTVATSRLGGGIFRLVDEKGAEVVLKGKPRTENGGKTVVLTPAARLEAGRKYKVVVRTGPSGVGFVEADGSISTLTGSAVIPVATRVSGESTEPGVAP